MESSAGPAEPIQSKGANVARRGSALQVLSVLLAVAAIGVAVLVPGPPGPPGPEGPGAAVAEHARGGVSTIGSSCTHYPGAEVAISVSGPGTVVVSATVGIGINHTFGLNDEARVVLAATDLDCTISNHTAFVSVPAPLPSDSSYYQTIPLLRTFSVTSARTYTFYVNGVMAQGGDANDRFDSASLVATYHPS